MNDLAREKLVEAALKGVKQNKGWYFGFDNSLCALGVLGYAHTSTDDSIKQLDTKYGFSDKEIKCPFIGNPGEKGAYEIGGCVLISNERHLVAHLNDIHDLSFLDIARKFPEDTECQTDH